MGLLGNDRISLNVETSIFFLQAELKDVKWIVLIMCAVCGWGCPYVRVISQPSCAFNIPGFLHLSQYPA